MALARSENQGRYGRLQRSWWDYPAAAVAVVAAAAATWLLYPVIKPEVSPLLLAAVIFSAWLGGVGPALLATVLSAAAIEFLTTPHGERMVLDAADLTRLSVFMLVGVTTGVLTEVHRRARAAAREAQSDATAANAAKDRFLAILSHELRNPLTPVLMLSSFRRNDPALPEDVQRDFDLIHRNIQIQSRLVDDLLDVTRIVHGKLPLHVETVDVRPLLRDAVRSIEASAADKGVTVQLEPTAGHHHVDADPARLSQVVLNLLRNAIKFTPAGGRIAVAARNTVAGKLIIEVADTGAGIDPAVLPAIFEPFEQGGERVTRQFGGLGLGLTISRSIIAAHGGRLTAASEGLGHGATFTVELPTVPAPAAVSPAKRGEGERAGEAISILLVEDHPDTARLLARLLRRKGYAVHVAGSLAQARRVAAHQQVDLVISDLGLPDGSGMDLMRELHDRAGLKGIALTGFGTEADVEQASAAGFLRHLTKPVEFEHLEQAIESMLNEGTSAASDR